MMQNRRISSPSWSLSFAKTRKRNRKFSTASLLYSERHVSAESKSCLRKLEHREGWRGGRRATRAMNHFIISKIAKKNLGIHVVNARTFRFFCGRSEPLLGREFPHHTSAHLLSACVRRKEKLCNNFPLAQEENMRRWASIAWGNRRHEQKETFRRWSQVSMTLSQSSLSSDESIALFSRLNICSNKRMCADDNRVASTSWSGDDRDATEWGAENKLDSMIPLHENKNLWIRGIQGNTRWFFAALTCSW